MHFKGLIRCNILALTSLVAIPCICAEPEISDDDLPRVPPTPAENALTTFKLRPGIQIQLVAAEPLVVDPIALCFDENSRMYVIEMRDYSERRDERLGRIKLLEDTDGDGRMDKGTVFAEGLPWPTALIYSNGGLFVGSTPEVYFFKDTDGDGKADEKKLVFTGFGSEAKRLNVQQLFNSFNWTLDQRIAGASGGNGGVISCVEHPEYPKIDLRNSDFSFDPNSLLMRKENGGGQYGMSFDIADRKFVCSNSSHIRQVMFEQRYLTPGMTYPMPNPSLDIPVDGPAAEVYRISPDEPWRVIRTKWRVSGLVPGPIEGGGRASGYFTGATGITIYRGTALGKDFEGDAFIGDAGSNLVHRKKVLPNGVPFKAERPADEQHVEFLASTDNWFRPVQFANAPDGALYICDMYREVIEHPWSLPPNLKKHLDLNSGNDRGRIYRVVMNDFLQPPLPRLEKAPTDKLVALLEHPNGWHRETAARLLFERQDKRAVEPTRKLLRTTQSAAGQIEALATLVNLGALSLDDVLVGFQSSSADVRECAVRFSETLPTTAKLLTGYEHLISDLSARVRYQLIWSISTRTNINTAPYLARLAASANDRWESEALLAVISRNPGSFFEEADVNLPIGFGSKVAYLAGARGDLNAFSAALAFIIKIQPVKLQIEPAANLILGLQKGKPEWIPTAISQLPQATAIAFEQVRIETNKLQLSHAVSLLAPDYIPAHRTNLLSLFSPNTPTEKQIGVMSTLAQTSPKTFEAALSFWPQWTPEIKSAVLEKAVAQTRLHGALLESLRAGRILPAELDARQVIKLKASSAQFAAYFKNRASEGGESQSSRAEVIRKFQPALSLNGDGKAGKILYQNNCSPCHRLNGEGNSVGPDLESVRSAGKESILTNILDPNREVPPRFASYEIETKSGDELTGILASESPAGYSLRQANGQNVFIARDQVKKLHNTGKSLMPEGLEGNLTPQDLANLLACILGE